MKKAILACAMAAAACGAMPGPMGRMRPGGEILSLERQALDGWQTGNPDPMLAISDLTLPGSIS